MGWRQRISQGLAVLLLAATQPPANPPSSCTTQYDLQLVERQPETKKFLVSLHEQHPVADSELTPTVTPQQKRAALDSVLGIIHTEDLLQKKHDSLKTLYDTLGNTEQRAIAEYFHLEVPRVEVLTGAWQAYEYSLRIFGATSMQDSLSTANSLLSGEYAAWLDFQNTHALNAASIKPLYLRLNPFALAEPRSIAIHEKVHALQFSHFFGGLNASCTANSTSCMIAWEGQAEYFEDWLSHTTQFDAATQDTLPPLLYERMVKNLPERVVSNLGPATYAFFNKYSRGRTLFATLVLEKGLDSAAYLFTTKPPCPVALPDDH